jgi:hypothetical protein
MTTETKQPPVHDDPLAIKRCHSTLTQPHAVTTATGSACMQSNEKDTNHLLLHDVFHHDHEMLLIPISYGYHRAADHHHPSYRESRCQLNPTILESSLKRAPISLVEYDINSNSNHPRFDKRRSETITNTNTPTQNEIEFLIL